MREGYQGELAEKNRNREGMQVAGRSKARKVGYTVESLEIRGVQMRVGTRGRRDDANGRCKREGTRLDGLTLELRRRDSPRRLHRGEGFQTRGDKKKREWKREVGEGARGHRRKKKKAVPSRGHQRLMYRGERLQRRGFQRTSGTNTRSAKERGRKGKGISNDRKQKCGCKRERTQTEGPRGTRRGVRRLSWAADQALP